MSDNRELALYIKQYSALGFETEDIIHAYLTTSRKTLFFGNLVAISSQIRNIDSEINTRPSLSEVNPPRILESELEQSIRELLEQACDNSISLPNDMKREGLAPVWLRSHNNNSYFNALIQTLFQVKGFVLKIISYQEPENLSEILDSLNYYEETRQRKKRSVKLIHKLKELFGLMILGNKKRMDPCEVFDNISKFKGEDITNDNQLQPEDFCINLMERLSEGLEVVKQPRRDSIEADFMAESQCGSLLLSDNKKINDYVPSISSIDETTQNDFSTEELNEFFFGTTKDEIIFEWSEYKTKKGQNAIFGPITLDIKQQTIAKALETHFNCAIEGYKSPDGDIISARKRCWIVKAPRILSFTLQRLEYDMDKGKLKKNTSEFLFDLEISLDKYLLINKKKIQEHRGDEALKALFKKEKQLEDELSTLRKFDVNGNSIEHVLGESFTFIQNQLEELQDNDYINIDASGEVDEKLCCASDRHALESAILVLRDFQQKVGARIFNLEERKSRIQSKIQMESSSLHHLNYKLFSIVVNIGSQTTSRHYLSYIRNFKTNGWFRVSDSQVCEVQEEEVIKISKGGECDCCAYNLFYIQDEVDTHGFDEGELRDLAGHIDEELNNFVKKENHKFEIECNQFNSNIIKTIYNEYLMRMNRLSFDANNFAVTNKKKIFPSLPTLPIFNSFLLLDPSKAKEITRWKTLQDILSNSNVPYNILQGDRNNFYYRELDKLIVSKNCSYSLNSLELNYCQNTLHVSKKNEYMDYYKSIVLLKQIFNLVYLRKWKDAITAVACINDFLENHKIQEYNQWFFSFSSYLLVVLALKMCALMDMNYAQGNLEEVLLLQRVLIYCLSNKKAIKPPKIFYTQLTSNMNYTASLCAKKEDQEPEMVIFKHMITKLEEPDLLPLGDVFSSDFKEMLKEIKDLDKNEDFILSPAFSTDSSLSDLYKRSVLSKLTLWIEFEEIIRKKGYLISQDLRVEKESYTYILEQ